MHSNIHSVQFSSVAQLCTTICNPMNHSTPGLPVHHQLPEFTQTHVLRVGDAIQLSHPLSSPSPPAPNPSQHQGLSNESTLHIRWLKYWSFSFSISPSNEHPGLISFRMDWLDLLAVHGTLKSLLWHNSSKVLILLLSVFFIVQLSHPYMTTGKTIVLIRLTFVGKVMSLLFNILSQLAMTFLPRSKGKGKSFSHAQLFATPWTVFCTKLLCPVDFLGKNTRVGCHFFLQGIFPTQGLNQVSHIVDRHFTIWATREVLPRSKSVL